MERRTLLELETGSPEETRRVADALGRALSGGAVLALVGDLGSGKTTFTKGLVAGLGCSDPDAVSSPTYVLEQIYPGRLPVHHYDVYRLSGGDELAAIGFDEHLGTEAVLVVEWADRVAEWMPQETLEIEFSHRGEAERRLRFFGPSSWKATLAKLSV